MRQKFPISIITSHVGNSIDMTLKHNVFIS